MTITVTKTSCITFEVIGVDDPEKAKEIVKENMKANHYPEDRWCEMTQKVEECPGDSIDVLLDSHGNELGF